ncbi:MAG: VanW family protein [Candidatus Magasanikbacteria bacterium GW2011_GWA2_37_8]|uniref:VanW family protein n=1 Tax=Candidatus Magasanikbacteria bacterium GW2011_GWA2_37_8 TaxID=1619036 RepID=A0A0G0HEL1_9BACT|nr:MAG: VanW family protein [Candidatus Magasanikbacteria bacterium GW2011_GWA2_37_8]
MLLKNNSIEENLLPKASMPWWKKVLIIKAVVIGLIVIIFGATVVYVKAYSDKVYPGVTVGKVGVGGLNLGQVKEFVEVFNNRLVKEGLTLSVYNSNTNSTTKVVLPILSDGDNSNELASWNSEFIAEEAIKIGKEGNWWQKMVGPWEARFFGSRIFAKLQWDENKITDELHSHLDALADEPHNANIVVENLNPLQYKLVPEKSGWMFDYFEIKEEVKKQLGNLELRPVEVYAKQYVPKFDLAAVTKLTDKLPEVLKYGNFGLNYIDPQTKIRRDWLIAPEEYTQWLEVTNDENGQAIFSLARESVEKYLINLRLSIDEPALDAKFVVANGKVKEFQGSRTGLSLNVEKSYEAIMSAWNERNYRPAETNKTVSLIVDIIEPKVKMAEINDLGIVEVVGVGVSSFKGSHTNRIKNIARAIELLNGALIKPDEEFSSLKYAGPFTLENGFLPEKVIKGNEIKLEVGGGMCQIGTTLFRMAMNSGMDITERRNHSLVVGYYADPVNGNPGTDATLYEPILDLKFKNDTGRYLLLQTEMDYKKMELRFTLWGTNDGRKGWYTHPTVSKWIPAGDPITIVKAGLKPEEESCQEAYKGAVASFTYTRVTPAGDKIARVFDSYYRPLPKTCLVAATSTPAVAPVEPIVDVPIEVIPLEPIN